MIQGQRGVYQTYQEYLESVEWATRRAAAIERAGSRCQLCNRDGHLQVHHRTYERVGHENTLDLTVLCDECHAWFHVPRSARLREEGEALKRQVDAGDAMDGRRVAMHLSRSLRMERAAG